MTTQQTNGGFKGLVDSHRTKTEMAIEALRSAITEGAISPGERLTVTRVATQLGMSPTPVREAFRILQAEGLINHTPHHGVAVTTLTEAQAREIYLLRGLLEGLAVRLAVPRLGPADLERLEGVISAMRAAAASHDAERLTQLNETWHLSFAALSGSELLQEFITRLWRMYPHDAIWTIPGQPARSLEEHSVVMRALRAGDVAAAGDAMTTHISNVQSLLLTRLTARRVPAAERA